MPKIASYIELILATSLLVFLINSYALSHISPILPPQSNLNPNPNPNLNPNPNPNPNSNPNLYGNSRYSVGLDDNTCKKFVASVPNPADRLTGVAGLFNTGTNLLTNVLHESCKIPGRKGGGMRSQVPWGKHNPAFWRTQHFAKSAANVNQTNVLPIVIIKDPLFWMGSMCRHSYAAKWRRIGNCPNLVHPEDHTEHYEVVVDFQNNASHVPPGRVHYDSLIDAWNTWYLDYLNADFPRVMIRFEDLLFHQEEVARELCDCVEGEWLKHSGFDEVEGSAKGTVGAHKNGNGRAEALARYGSKELREEGLNDFDKAFVMGSVDKRLMEIFHYSL